MGRVTEWLNAMREARNPGPMVRVHATRSQREAGWVFDLAEDTELGELAARIATTCIPKGGRAHCELRALDADGRIIGTLACKLDILRIARAAVDRTHATAWTGQLALPAQSTAPCVRGYGCCSSREPG